MKPEYLSECRCGKLYEKRTYLDYDQNTFQRLIFTHFVTLKILKGKKKREVRTK